MPASISPEHRERGGFRSTARGRFTAPPPTVRLLSPDEGRRLPQPYKHARFFAFRKVAGGIIGGYGKTEQEAMDNMTS